MNRRTIAPLIAMVLALGAWERAATAQAGPPATLTGDWKASLDAGGRALRLVLHITPAQSGFAASLDSVDQAVFGLAVDSIRIEPRRRCVRAAPRTAADIADWTWGKTVSFPLSFSSRISRLPMMIVSKLLKSCATPPVSWPTASTFCDWRNRYSISSRSEISVSSRAWDCERSAAKASMRRMYFVRLHS